MTDVITEQMIDEWGERYSNWQRWGPDDQLGTLNFITREHIRTACTLPRSGRTISCALPCAVAPDTAENDAAESDAANDDAAQDRGDSIETRWTTLTHVIHDGLGYNGRNAGNDVNSPAQMSARVVGRGVLLDLPRYTRLPWLGDGTRINPNDLDLCAESFGVTIERGDLVLVRTGQLRRRREEGSWQGDRADAIPGLSLRCARWIFQREIAALATDTSDLEVRPNESGCPRALRRLAVRDTGLLLGTMFDLEELADTCAADGNYAFLLVAPTLPIEPGDHARTNPIAIK
jgi:kynurenine formamidase